MNGLGKAVFFSKTRPKVLGWAKRPAKIRRGARQNESIPEKKREGGTVTDASFINKKTHPHYKRGYQGIDESGGRDTPKKSREGQQLGGRKIRQGKPKGPSDCGGGGKKGKRHWRYRKVHAPRRARVIVPPVGEGKKRKQQSVPAEGLGEHSSEWGSRSDLKGRSRGRPWRKLE